MQCALENVVLIIITVNYHHSSSSSRCLFFFFGIGIYSRMVIMWIEGIAHTAQVHRWLYCQTGHAQSHQLVEASCRNTGRGMGQRSPIDPLVFRRQGSPSVVDANNFVHFSFGGSCAWRAGSSHHERRYRHQKNIIIDSPRGQLNFQLAIISKITSETYHSLEVHSGYFANWRAAPLLSTNERAPTLSLTFYHSSCKVTH